MAKEVIGKDWVESSTRGWSKLPDRSGLDREYGFAWHICHFNVDNHVYRMYFAAGNGGAISNGISATRPGRQLQRRSVRRGREISSLASVSSVIVPYPRRFTTTRARVAFQNRR